MQFYSSANSKIAKLIFVLVLGISIPEQGLGLSISGRVFFDRNGDGVQQPDEAGLSHVSISDGREVVQTSKAGQYSFETEKGRIVFVSLPKGYRTSGKFYTLVESAGEINFAMEKWDESAKESFRFVQITDIHIGEEEHNVSTFIEDIQEINSSYPEPAFVLATGDLVKNGENRFEYENYLRGTSHFKLPVFNLPGNHDLHGGSLPNYQHFLGPDYYSFNAGSCHFVLLNSSNIDQQQKEWLKKDVAVVPKGISLIFAFHYLPGIDELRLLKEYKALAVFTGHWHGSRVCENDGMTNLNTPPLRFGGIDRHPRGFRVIDVNHGKLENSDLRLGGFNHHAAIVAPQGTVKTIDGSIPIVVNAYDTRCDIDAIQCSISGRLFSLKQVSSWSWRGEFKLPGHLSGEQKMKVLVKSANGDTWEKETIFTIADKTGIEAPLCLKWIASTGGIIGFSSPKFGENCIAVGVDDKGDLSSCGIAAFTKDGKKMWHYHTDSAVKNNIAAANGCIYATSVTGWLYALDETSGKLLWKASLDADRPERWEVASTTVANGIVYAGGHSYVAAFDARDGKLIWETRNDKNDWKPTSYSVPVVVQNKLVVTTRTNVYVLDAQTGQLFWKQEGVFYGCLVANDTIYTNREGVLVAMALATGKQLWAGKEKIGGAISSPAIADGKLVTGISDGRVCAFSVQDGALLWSAQTGETLSSTQPYERGGKEVNNSPVIFNQSVYAGAGDGKIHVFSLADGKDLGSYSIGVPVMSSPFISDSTLYIGAYDGNLYSFLLNVANK
ncbi:MAG: hypothetical protein A2W90_06305 [Bacteroidetes bacterium GWF2_42_66]|nr:MAG: hypothetical protein A2W92_20815 [Bacteroidetes bacterium GWA2_42_15]OFX99643.1 MAG: hypothetical protein A2W89_00450 [Bacteroidetes bacterium GWE2_42_39]OFY39538.1 MAG: hypothetical protein A2W90_06305 [Bacteroidetes bacterium GWF2_42_66]